MKITTHSPLQKLLNNKEKFHIFNNMSDANISSVISDVAFKVFKEGDAIIEKGSTLKVVYLIIYGECRVESNDFILGEISNNTIFGEISGLTNGERIATIRATKDTGVFTFLINHNQFKKNLISFAYFYRNIATSIIEKLIILNNRT